MAEQASPRAHDFIATRFHVPTWCTHCKLFVRNPLGKQGFSCQACHAHIHKSCLDVASKTPCVIRCTDSFILIYIRISHDFVAPKPSRMPHKMIGAKLTERKEKVIAIEQLAASSPRMFITFFFLMSPTPSSSDSFSKQKDSYTDDRRPSGGYSWS